MKAIVFSAIVLLPFSGELPAQTKLQKFTARASAIDPLAKAHPEIDFVFEKDGKVQDTQHACVDTGVKSQGKLVIWLMGHNQELFTRLSGYGFHSIQIHYANGWFGKLTKLNTKKDDLFYSKIRLEAAIGEDSSEFIEIPKPDSIMERSYQFVKWLDHEHPQGRWKQFLTADGKGLQWDKVILSGISHGSTTAARFAKHTKVDRVVMFSGPRDNTEVWQKLPSATPENRYFGFTHVLDGGWTGDHYCRSWILLGMNKFGPLVNADSAKPPYENSRRLITSADVGGKADRAHNASIPGKASVKDASGKYVYEEVWRYLFTHPVETTGKAERAESDCDL